MHARVLDDTRTCPAFVSRANGYLITAAGSLLDYSQFERPSLVFHAQVPRQFSSTMSIHSDVVLPLLTGTFWVVLQPIASVQYIDSRYK